MLIAFVDISKNVGTRAEVGFAQLLFLTMLQAPATILVLTPFIFLFGTLGAFVGLNRRSELIAMRAAGVSAWRFIMPAAIAAFVMGVLTLTLLNPLTSAMSAQFETSRNALMENYLKSAPKGCGCARATRRPRSSFAPGRATRSTARCACAACRCSSTPCSPMASCSSRSASRPTRRGWSRASGGCRGCAWPCRAPGRSAPRPIRCRPTWTTAPRRSGSTIPRPSPSGGCRDHQAHRGGGLLVHPLPAALQQVLATPVLFAAMSVLAAAFSLRLMRLGGLAGLAGAGVTLGFGFFFFNELCGALGKADVLTPAMAAWTPPIVALLAGLTLLCYTEDG
jgi:lipopolysaccharide export system permease protein